MLTAQDTVRRPIEDEAGLVARAIQRDSEAFGQLYEACLDRIYRYVYYRVNSTTEAEDLTEQVFLKAWEAIDRYEQRGVPFLAWLYRLAHNLVVDHYRSQRQTVPLDDLRETEEASEDIEASVHAQLDAEEVREAIQRLSPEHQQLITLRFVEGLSHAEVAQIVGKSEGATRVVQYRALQALARALECRERPRNAKRGNLNKLSG